MRNRGLILLAILLLIPPAKSITWQEVYDAIKAHKYDFPIYARNKKVTCIKIVSWEEYVEGSGHYRGYVREQQTKRHIPCP